MTTSKPAPPPVRDADAELEALFAAIDDVILVLDAEGRYVKIAPTNPSLLYRPAAELLGKTLGEVFDPAQAKQFMDANPQEARAILAKYTKLPEAVVQKIPFVTYRFWLDPRDFAVWVNVLKDLGQITRSVDENSLVVKLK